MALLPSAAWCKRESAEPTITRIDFAPGHEDEQDVAGKLRLMKAAPKLLAIVERLASLEIALANGSSSAECAAIQLAGEAAAVVLEVKES